MEDLLRKACLAVEVRLSGLIDTDSRVDFRKWTTDVHSSHLFSLLSRWQKLVPTSVEKRSNFPSGWFLVFFAVWLPSVARYISDRDHVLQPWNQFPAIYVKLNHYRYREEHFRPTRPHGASFVLLTSMVRWLHLGSSRIVVVSRILGRGHGHGYVERCGEEIYKSAPRIGCPQLPFARN